MRVSFLVDGFNLYHSVKDVGGVGVRWLDLMSFCKSYLSSISPTATLNRVQYFSSLATHLQTYDPDTLNRQRAFISCLKDSGVEVTMGKFKKITVSSLWFPGNVNFRLQIQRHEEKETDVAIAAHLIEQLADNTCDAAVLVTGDTDQAAGVRVAKRMFPQKEIFILYPVGRKNDDLEKLVKEMLVKDTFKATKRSYSSNQFPDPYKLQDGNLIYKPKGW